MKRTIFLNFFKKIVEIRCFEIIAKQNYVDFFLNQKKIS
jgi:hypothetical protein